MAGGCDSLYCVELKLKPGIDTTVMADTICEGLFTEFFAQTIEKIQLQAAV